MQIKCEIVKAQLQAVACVCNRKQAIEVKFAFRIQKYKKNKREHGMTSQSNGLKNQQQQAPQWMNRKNSLFTPFMQTI